MDYIKIKFFCVILRMLDDGFIAQEKGYIIKFFDKKKQHLFNKGDLIAVSIENVEKAGNDTTKQGYSVIFCQLKNYLSNGFQFIDLDEPQKGFFFNYRGSLSNQRFENNDFWERESILRISIIKS